MAPVSAAQSLSPLPMPPLSLQHHMFALLKSDGYLSQFINNGRRKHLMGGAVENGTWQKQWKPGEIHEIQSKELSALNALINVC